MWSKLLFFTSTESVSYNHEPFVGFPSSSRTNESVFKEVPQRFFQLPFSLGLDQGISAVVSSQSVSHLQMQIHCHVLKFLLSIYDHRCLDIDVNQACEPGGQSLFGWAASLTLIFTQEPSVDKTRKHWMSWLHLPWDSGTERSVQRCMQKMHLILSWDRDREFVCDGKWTLKVLIL